MRGSGRRGVVSGKVGAVLPCGKAGEGVARGGGKRRAGRIFRYLGSLVVVRAHNLLNGVWPLGGVEAEEPIKVNF